MVNPLKEPEIEIEDGDIDDIPIEGTSIDEQLEYEKQQQSDDDDSDNDSSDSDGDDGDGDDDYSSQVDLQSVRDEARREALEQAKLEQEDAIAQARHEEQQRTRDMQIAYATEREKNIGKEMTDLRRKLAEAEEDDNTEKKLEIEEKLEDLKAEKTKVGNARQTLEANPLKEPEKKAGKKTDSDTQDSGDAGDDVEKQRVNDSAFREWINKNSWFNKSVEERTSNEIVKRELAIHLDAKMRSEGKRPLGKAYYAELTKRLDEQMAKRTKKQRRTNNTVGNAPSNTKNNPNSTNKVVITKEDKFFAKKFDLDLSDPEVAKELAFHKNNPDGRVRQVRKK